MKYHELLVEYKKLLADDVRLRQEMHLIPKGYLVTKKIAGKMYIETPRMIIRDFTRSDAADLHDIFGDDETMENCEPA